MVVKIYTTTVHSIEGKSQGEDQNPSVN